MTLDITPTEGNFRVVHGAGHQWAPVEGLRDFDRLEEATAEADRIRAAALPNDLPTAVFDRHMKRRWFNGAPSLSFSHGGVLTVTGIVERFFGHKPKRRPGGYRWR